MKTTVPRSPEEQEPKPIEVKRSLSVDLNDLCIRPYVCCANCKIALIKPTKWKRKISLQAHGGPALWVIFLCEWKQIPGSLCKMCCTTKEKLALWKPGRKVSGSRHVGIAQRLAQESKIFCVLCSSVQLPVSNSHPSGRMQCNSLRSGGGRQVGAERCWFCATPEGYLEGVKVSISGYSVPSNLHCGNASNAAHFSTVFSLKSGFSLAAGPQWLSLTIFYHLFMEMNVKIVLGAQSAYSSTWEQLVFCSPASVPDTFVSVTWFPPRAIYGASITYKKWDLRLKNLDSTVAVRSLGTVLFLKKKNLSGESKTVENQIFSFLLTSTSAKLLYRKNSAQNCMYK